MVLDPDQIFVKIVSGGADVNHKSAIGEPAGNGDVPDVTRSDKPLPAGIDEDASIDDIKGSQSSSKVSEC
jgi:hypothetical protein